MVHPIDPDSIRAVANELRALAPDPSTMRAGDDGTGAAPPDAPDPAAEVLLGLGRLVAELGARIGVDLSTRDAGEVIRRLQALAQVFGKNSTAALVADLGTGATRDRLATFFRLLPAGPGFALPADHASLADIWFRIASRAGPNLLPWLARELGDGATARLVGELETLSRGLGLRGHAELLAPGAWAGSTAVRAGTIAALLRAVPPQVLSRLVADEMALPMLDASVPPEELTPYLTRLGGALGSNLLGPARTAVIERLRLLVGLLRAGTLEGLVEQVERDPALRGLVRAVLLDADAPGGAAPGAATTGLSTRDGGGAAGRTPGGAGEPAGPGAAPGAAAAPGGPVAPRPPGVLQSAYGAVSGRLAQGGTPAAPGATDPGFGLIQPTPFGPGADPRAVAAEILGLPTGSLAGVDRPAFEHGLAGLAGLRGLAGAEQLLAAARTQPEIHEALRQLVRALSGLAAGRGEGGAALGIGAAATENRAAATGQPGLREQVAALLGLPADALDPAGLAEDLVGLAGLRGIADPSRLLATATDNPVLRELMREMLWTAPRRPAEDPDRFARLMRDFLPQAVRDGHPRRPRIWNAACGSGLDACSMAIAAAEADPPIDLRILATDDPGALLQAARRATYSEAALALIGPARVRRWFRPVDGRAQLGPEVRALIEVRAHRLVDPAPGTDFSIVVSRWRLPILPIGERSSAFERFADALLPGGWLMVDEDLELPAAVAGRFRPLGTGLFRRD